MAAEDKDDRTEQASGRRLGEAIGRGDVPMSRELSLWVGLVVGVFALIQLGGGLRDALIRLIVATTQTVNRPNFFQIVPHLQAITRLVFMIGGSAMLAGAVSFALQTGGRFWPDRLWRGLDSLFNLKALTGMFSKDMLIDIGRAIIKALMVGYVAWWSLGDDFLTLPQLIQARPDAQFAMLFRPLAKGAVNVLAAIAIFAGLDLALNRYRYKQGLKMTKQEVKQENKEDEGDPLIKSRRRRKHRELARGMARKEVPRADVLLVNPTHIAIALRYRPGQDRAPIVTAKGKGELAEFMRELARNNSIPIVEDIPLARLLYRKVKIGRSVPSDTFKAVAAVLAFVYRMTRRPVAGIKAPGTGVSP